MVAVLVAVVNQINGLLAIVLTEQVGILVLVARGDKPLQAKELKVIGKIRKEVRNSWVVAVAKHRLSAEMFAVVLQLLVDVLQLRVELVLLGLLGRAQVLVCHKLLVILKCVLSYAPFFTIIVNGILIDHRG